VSLAISPLNDAWLQRAAEHQARLTMPAGALGRLLDLGRQLCAIQETLQPHSEPAAVLVMAADHGIAAEGVSAYPQAVTGQMVANFLHGGAAINVLARRQKARVLVIDMGVKSAFPLSHPDFVADLALGSGTANFLRGPAMTPAEAEQALAAGRRIVAERLAPDGAKVVALGEMGIANTASASALAALLTGRPVESVTGRGTGVDDAGWKRKVDVIRRALELHFPARSDHVDPIAALTAVGGFEIAGLAGAALEAAARRMVVVLDGFISSVAGLIACRIAPEVRGYCVAAHQSVEAGHQAVLQALDLVPLFDLGMRLGEGTGAALALNLLACAADIMRDMATFESAGVERSSAQSG
jgi:nicotinate-nucleotide--dimethylbenzimidazole phosphoribosyltransferase